MTRRKAIAIAAATAVALVLGLFFVLQKNRPHRNGVIVGFYAVEAGGALIVWRESYENKPSTGWVTRIDAHGRETWTRAIPSEPMMGGTGPIVVVDDVAIVRYGKATAESEPKLAANAAVTFDLQSGDELWDQELATYTPYDDPVRRLDLPMYVSDLALGRQLISFSNADGKEVVKAMVARTGAVTWQRDRRVAAAGPTLIGTAGFALHPPEMSGAELINAATGNSVILDVAGPGCAVGDEYVAVKSELDGEPPALVAFRVDGTKSRVIAAPFEALTMKHPHVKACGRYKDRFVFFVESLLQRSPAIVITDAVGVRLHEILLSEGINPMSRTHRVDPAHAYLSGELTRFVPFPDNAQDVRGALVMLDLESGTIAWRAAADQTTNGSLFRSGSHWIWIEPGMSATISVFDGNTGQLVAATVAHSSNGIYTRATSDSTLVATPDTLWVFAQDRTPPDEAALVALELPTLKPRFPPRIIELTDATRAVRDRLKLP